MTEDDELIEKRCSKCGLISWDSQTGLYTDPCPKGGNHDANGGTV